MITRGKPLLSDEVPFPQIAAPAAPYSVGPQPRRLKGPANGSDIFLEVAGPSLIRWDSFSNAGTQADAIRVTFQGAGGSLNEDAALPTIGGYTYLPLRGKYRLHALAFSTDWTGGNSLDGMLFENVDPIFALALLASPLASFCTRTTQYVLSAAVDQRIDGIDAGVIGNTFRVQALTVSNVITAGNPAIITFGRKATINNGHPLAALATLQFPPGSIGGQTVSAFSNLGTTISVTIAYR